MNSDTPSKISPRRRRNPTGLAILPGFYYFTPRSEVDSLVMDHKKARLRVHGAREALNVANIEYDPDL